MVSFSGLISIFRQASPHFYMRFPRPDIYNYSTRNSDMLRLTHAAKNWGKQRVCYHSLKCWNNLDKTLEVHLTL